MTYITRVQFPAGKLRFFVIKTVSRSVPVPTRPVLYLLEALSWNKTAVLQNMAFASVKFRRLSEFNLDVFERLNSAML